MAVPPVGGEAATAANSFASPSSSSPQLPSSSPAKRRRPLQTPSFCQHTMQRGCARAEEEEEEEEEVVVAAAGPAGATSPTAPLTGPSTPERASPVTRRGTPTLGGIPGGSSLTRRTLATWPRSAAPCGNSVMGTEGKEATVAWADRPSPALRTCCSATGATSWST